jgi:hypothetical protein
MTNNQPVEVLPLEEALNQGPVFTTQNRDLRTDLTLHNEHCLNPDDNDLDHAYELNVTNIRVVEGRVTADVKVGRYKDVSTQKGRFTVIKNTPVWEKTIENLVFLDRDQVPMYGVRDSGSVDYGHRAEVRRAMPESVLDTVMDALFSPVEDSLIQLSQSLGNVKTVYSGDIKPTEIYAAPTRQTDRTEILKPIN